MFYIVHFLYGLLVLMPINIVQASFSSAESKEQADHIYDFPFHNRSAWGARMPKDVIPLKLPAPYIVIHDSGEPPSIEIAGCFNFSQCSTSMKNIQDIHMDENGWWDIGYNFAVGGDGATYEGRGWAALGAHAKYFNTLSVGICLIGSFNSKLPTLLQLNAVHQLIGAGVEMGYINPDFRLVTHGQVRNTTCPGKKLEKKVQTWLHHSNFPGSPKDLLVIPEIPDSVKDSLRKDIASVSVLGLWATPT